MKIKSVDKVPNGKNIQAKWMKGLDFLGNEDYKMAINTLKEAWELLPQPKIDVDLAYNICGDLVNAHLQSSDFKEALKWAKILQDCDKERIDDGDREFKLGVTLFELGEKDKAKKLLQEADKKSEGVVFEDENPKYKKFIKSK